MMNTKKIIELCGEIEREADYICRYTKTGAIYGDIQAILARVEDIRSAVGIQSESHRAYWIPTECGVKCSSCNTEYADSDYLYMMYQCPHCFAEMGETRKAHDTELYDLLVKINAGMLAGYDCIMDVFDESPESVAKRCGESGANCEKCLQTWMNEEAPF